MNETLIPGRGIPELCLFVDFAEACCFPPQLRRLDFEAIQ